MLETQVRDLVPDARIPRLTIGPQAAATLAMAGDHAAARVALVLAVAVNVPLHLAGRLDRRYPDLPSMRPLAAMAWAVTCVAVIGPALGAGLHGAALAAAWSSLAIGVLLYLVPGPWSRAGASRRTGDPASIRPRHAAAHIARRLAGVALLASVVAFVPAPGPSTASAWVALAALITSLWLDRTPRAPVSRRDDPRPGGGTGRSSSAARR